MRVKGEDVVLEGLERRNVRWVLGNEVEPDYLRSRGTGLVEGRREEMVNDSGKRGIPIDFVCSNEDVNENRETFRGESKSCDAISKFVITFFLNG